MDASAPPVVTLSGVSLRYGKTVALDGITLDIPAGRMVGPVSYTHLTLPTKA